MDPLAAASSAAQGTLRFDPDLIRKYDGFGPRYTSYPTADRFHAGFTGARYVDALDRPPAPSHAGSPPASYGDALAARNRAGAAQPLSLYVHLPFCNTICYY